VGDGIASLSMDERATLANLSVEAGALTGIVEVDDRALDWLTEHRALTREELGRRVVRADPDAAFSRVIEIDLAEAKPMVARPGDPRSAVSLAELLAREGTVRVDIAYGGSCTGSKASDVAAYATAVRGRRIAPGVRFYVQFGSRAVRAVAEQEGHSATLEAAGALLLEPACGACIRAGPGVSERPDQVTISAGSRNFAGRSGPGQVYLGSPYTVAAAAVTGHLVDPRDLFS
jgi:3-isopropylmalate/(R)-2-methylmalate dehydratase large subunit